MVERNVVLAKVDVIDRCLRRVAEVQDNKDRRLSPLDVDDITILCITRAAQATVDLAAHVVAAEGYGLPAAVSDTFSLLQQHGIIDANLADRLQKMVGFRNIAVHNYQTVDPRILKSIVDTRLDDLRTFAAIVTAWFAVS